MRLAETRVENDALDARVAYADQSATARQCKDEVDAFTLATSSSKATLSCRLAVLDFLVNRDTNLLVSFYKQVRGSGARMPEDTDLDNVRERNDATVSPHYYLDLNYLALSLDGHGVRWYGDFYLTFKDSMISERSTVFEENPLTFLNKHQPPPNKPVAPGYRATWDRRADLAKAKLVAKIDRTTTSDQFPSILLEPGRVAEDTDFIEVHVFGPLHQQAIESVIAHGPTDDVDRKIWKRNKQKLASLGVPVVEL